MERHSLARAQSALLFGEWCHAVGNEVLLHRSQPENDGDDQGGNQVEDSIFEAGVRIITYEDKLHTLNLYRR